MLQTGAGPYAQLLIPLSSETAAAFVHPPPDLVNAVLQATAAALAAAAFGASAPTAAVPTTMPVATAAFAAAAAPQPPTAAPAVPLAPVPLDPAAAEPHLAAPLPTATVTPRAAANWVLPESLRRMGGTLATPGSLFAGTGLTPLAMSLGYNLGDFPTGAMGPMTLAQHLRQQMPPPEDVPEARGSPDLSRNARPASVPGSLVTPLLLPPPAAAWAASPPPLPQVPPPCPLAPRTLLQTAPDRLAALLRRHCPAATVDQLLSNSELWRAMVQQAIQSSEEEEEEEEDGTEDLL